MTQRSLTQTGTLTFDVNNFLTMNPTLINSAAGYGLAHVLFSHIRRSGQGGRVNRRVARKMANRRRRRFVDNIIMHHKRLHDRNREAAVGNARLRALARQKKSKSLTTQATSLQHKRSNSQAYSAKTPLLERAKALRSNTESKRIRAQSRWASIMRMENAASDNIDG